MESLFAVPCYLLLSSLLSLVVIVIISCFEFATFLKLSLIWNGLIRSFEGYHLLRSLSWYWGERWRILCPLHLLSITLTQPFRTSHHCILTHLFYPKRKNNFCFHLNNMGHIRLNDLLLLIFTITLTIFIVNNDIYFLSSVAVCHWSRQWSILFLSLELWWSTRDTTTS